MYKVIGIKRSKNNICILCEKNNSVKRNSHLIPKFFAKSIFSSNADSRASGLKHGKLYANIVQDSPKEDYIFCNECELFFSFIERQSSFYFNNFHEREIILEEKNEIHRLGSICKPIENVPNNLLNVFFYSIVFRVGSSRLELFKNLNISEELLRKTKDALLLFYATSESALLSKVDSVKLPAELDFAIFTCLELPDESYGLITGVSLSNVHLIHANRFVIHVNKIGYKSNNNLFCKSSKICFNICTSFFWEKYFVKTVLGLNQFIGK